MDVPLGPPGDHLSSRNTKFTTSVQTTTKQCRPSPSAPVRSLGQPSLAKSVVAIVGPPAPSQINEPSGCGAVVDSLKQRYRPLEMSGKTGVGHVEGFDPLEAEPGGGGTARWVLGTTKCGRLPLVNEAC